MSSYPVAVSSSPGSSSTLGFKNGYQYTGIVKPRASGPDLQLLGFQGAGTLGTVFASNFSEAQNVISTLANLEQLTSLIQESVGAFTMQIYVRESGRILFINDPLGSGMLITYYSEGIAVVGVDVTTIKRTLFDLGISLSRDPLFEFARASTGTAAYGADTPYRELAVLPSGQGISISADGKVSTFNYHTEKIINEMVKLPYDELIELGTQKIVANLSALLNCRGQEIFSDITGGFDSRLVLAGLSRINSAGSVTLTSIKGAPEWEIATKLAAYSGFAITDQRFKGNQPGCPNTFVESTLSGARASGGLIENGLDPLTPPAAVLTLQGGFGETFRTFSSYHLKNLPDVSNLNEITDSLWKWTALKKFQIKGQNLFQKELFDQLTDRAGRFIQARIDQSISADYLLNQLYLDSRNRYWIGQQSYWRSEIQTRFDPLYNLPLIGAAKKITFADRRDNFVGLDAMRKLAPDLLELPFFNAGVISPRYRASREMIQDKQFPTDVGSNYIAVPFPGRSSLRRVGGVAAEDVEARQLAAKLGSRYLDIVGIKEWGAEGFEYIASDPVFAGYFNLTVLEELLTNVPESAKNALMASKLLRSFIRLGAFDIAYLSPADRFLLS